MVGRHGAMQMCAIWIQYKVRKYLAAWPQQAPHTVNRRLLYVYPNARAVNLNSSLTALRQLVAQTLKKVNTPLSHAQ